jgi:hypothetical protein
LPIANCRLLMGGFVLRRRMKLWRRVARCGFLWRWGCGGFVLRWRVGWRGLAWFGGGRGECVARVVANAHIL